MGKFELNEQEQLLDNLLCIRDPKRAMENYLKVFDLTQGGMVPFKLFPKQRDLVKNYENGRHNVVKKYRQAGISTVTQGYCAVKAAYADTERPEEIIIMANKLTTATKFAKAIKNFVYQLPPWLFPENDKGEVIRFTKESEKHLTLPNGSQIISVATSDDALRGYTPTILILDEAAFIEGGQATWSACLASVSTGGKIFLISTPNGLDEIYYAAYENAIEGISDFMVTEMDWWQDPRYNGSEISEEKFRTGLRLVKTDDIVDYIRKPADEKIEEVINVDNITLEHLTNEDIEYIQYMITEGYIPYSDWFEDSCRAMNLNKRKIAQELLSAFIGSGDNVIDDQYILEQERLNVRRPLRKEKQDSVWIWEEPQIDHRYILGLDVSRGDSEDKTGLVIIDFDTWEQVLEYHGHTTPDIAAEIAAEYGKRYGAFVCLDLTGMGLSASSKLKEIYPSTLMYYEGVKDSELIYGAPPEKFPGLNFGRGNTRNQVVAEIEEAFRTGFKIRSQRMIKEAKKFIFKNGRADHMKGSHDDLLMGLGIALFMASSHFKRLNKNTNAVKEMLNSWQKSSTPIKPPVEHNQFNVKTNTSRIVDDFTKQNVDTHLNNTLRNTKTFGWLFGANSVGKK